MRPVPDDALLRHPIYAQAREVLTNPDIAVAAGPMAVRFALWIAASARGTVPRQRHRPANTCGEPR